MSRSPRRQRRPGPLPDHGGAQTHWVDLFTTGIARCDCGDHLWHHQICKPILAALLREGDERVLTALGELILHLRNPPIAA
ncbi:MAG: hypothetical protein ABJC36_03210 [Gemmatimonadales bacterium]